MNDNEQSKIHNEIQRIQQRFKLEYERENDNYPMIELPERIHGNIGETSDIPYMLDDLHTLVLKLRRQSN